MLFTLQAISDPFASCNKDIDCQLIQDPFSIPENNQFVDTEDPTCQFQNKWLEVEEKAFRLFQKPTGARLYTVRTADLSLLSIRHTQGCE
jgi:hypothetical protein